MCLTLALLWHGAGAGKTTTLQILTAEFPPSSGDATLAGFSVTKEPEKTRRRIGYCPQFDAHFENMTGREHVELYASIKGVPKEKVKASSAACLSEVGLSPEDCDRLSSHYSGGMKRRLSLACALIGQPQIVFLDECTTVSRTSTLFGRGTQNQNLRSICCSFTDERASILWLDGKFGKLFQTW